MKLTDETEMYRLYIEGLEGMQEIVINKNLTVNNIIAGM